MIPILVAAFLQAGSPAPPVVRECWGGLRIPVDQQCPPRVIHPFDIYFAPASAALTPESPGLLDNAATAYRIMFQTQRSLIILISGHSDRMGSTDANLRLSERRAAAALNYLLSNGIPRGAMSIRAMGEEQPVFPNRPEMPEPEDRRVGVFIFSLAV